jgi:hypothetical protein
MQGSYPVGVVGLILWIWELRLLWSVGHVKITANGNH